MPRRRERTPTQPGMGRARIDAERVTQAEMPAANGVTVANASPEDQLAQRITVRGETKWLSTPPPVATPSTQPTSSLRPVSEREPTDSKAPSTRPKSGGASSRVPVRVDDMGSAVRVGQNAVDLLRRTVPRVVRSRTEVAAAPIDHREGFVLSLIDGTTSVQALIDVGGMPDEDVLAALQRLRRLGIITLG